MKNMTRKVISVVLCCCMVLFMASCGKTSSPADNEPEAAVMGEKNILVAYFSWSGNTQQAARWIQEKTGGEIFRIVPEMPYEENDVFDRAKDELENETRPVLSEHIEEDIMAQYDVVFVGFPIWWYDLPMPVWTFLEEHDLAGKTVIPFFTHNGSSSGAGSITTLEKLCPDSTVMSSGYFSCSGNSISDAESDITEWLTGLGYIK